MQKKKKAMDIIESNKRMKALGWQVLGKPTDQQDSTETLCQGYQKLYFHLETLFNIRTERIMGQLIWSYTEVNTVVVIDYLSTLWKGKKMYV